jgi:hypothetical protein
MIVADSRPARAPLWLAVNSDGRVTTAVLAQMHRGRLAILADWLYEAEPATALPDIVMDAALENPDRQVASQGKTRVVALSRSPLSIVAPRAHFEGYPTIGLVGAVRKVPATPTRGADPLAGREELRTLMRRMTHGEPAFTVDDRARWTLRALTGGFARDVDKTEPHENSYRVLMEGLESFAGLLRGGVAAEDDTTGNFDYTPGGQRYRSARAR